MSAVQSAEPWAGQDICHYIPQWLTSVTFMAFRYSVWKILHLFSNICFKSNWTTHSCLFPGMHIVVSLHIRVSHYLRVFSIISKHAHHEDEILSTLISPFFDLNFLTLTVHFRLKGPKRSPCSKLSGHYTTHNWVCIFVCVDPAITCISWTVPSLQLNHAVNTCRLSMAVCPLICLSEACTRVRFSLYVSVYICRVCLCLVRQW